MYGLAGLLTSGVGSVPSLASLAASLNLDVALERAGKTLFTCDSSLFGRVSRPLRSIGCRSLCVEPIEAISLWRSLGDMLVVELGAPLRIRDARNDFGFEPTGGAGFSMA